MVRLPNGAVVPMSQQQYASYEIQNAQADAAAGRSAGVAMATERTKATAGAEQHRTDSLQKQAQDYAEKRSKYQGGMTALEEAERALQSQGVSYGERVANAAGVESPLVRKLAFGGKVADRDQAWQQFESQSLLALSGAGVSDKEREKFQGMFRGAGDTASRLNTIKIVRNRLQETDQTIRQGYDPEAVQMYESRGKKPAAASGKVRYE